MRCEQLVYVNWGLASFSIPLDEYIYTEYIYWMDTYNIPTEIYKSHAQCEIAIKYFGSGINTQPQFTRELQSSLYKPERITCGPSCVECLHFSSSDSSLFFLYRKSYKESYMDSSWNYLGGQSNIIKDSPREFLVCRSLTNSYRGTVAIKSSILQ